MGTLIETANLCKHFGPIRAVDELDLSVQAGEIYGLLGPNGSGKTTLIRLLTGLLLPTSGSVRILGCDMPDKAILAQVGYMTQADALYTDLTLRENVAFFAEICGCRDRQAIDDAIELIGLQDRASSLVGTLSGGMRQRTSLACALVHRPSLLLLDEPTVGVDPQLRAVFWQHFRQLADEGTTLVVSSHVMEEAERCDRLGFMRQGRLLAEGSSDALRAQTGTASLEEAFLCFADGANGAVP